MADANAVKVVCPICSGAKRVSWTAGDQTSSDPCGMCPDYATTGSNDLPTGWMRTTLAPGERERIYREELEKRIAGMEDVTAQALLSRMNTAGYEAWAVGAPRATYDLIRDALRAALLPSEGK